METCGFNKLVIFYSMTLSVSYTHSLPRFFLFPSLFLALQYDSYTIT